MKTKIFTVLRIIQVHMNTRLIKISILGWIVASLMLIYGRNVYATPTDDLKGEVDALNRAVSIYLEWGGNLEAMNDVQQVIAKLQTVSHSNDIPKFRGLLVDPSMAPVMQSSEESQTDEPRVLWNVRDMCFYASSSSGRPGIRFFVFE